MSNKYLLKEWTNKWINRCSLGTEGNRAFHTQLLFLCPTVGVPFWSCPVEGFPAGLALSKPGVLWPPWIKLAVDIQGYGTLFHSQEQKMARPMMSSSTETAEGERLDQWEHISRSKTQLHFTCWREWSLMDPNEEWDYTLLILKLQKVFTNGESPVLFHEETDQEKILLKGYCMPPRNTGKIKEQTQKPGH